MDAQRPDPKFNAGDIAYCSPIGYNVVITDASWSGSRWSYESKEYAGPESSFKQKSSWHPTLK